MRCSLRSLHSLRSFTFFLGFISRQKLKKRTEKNVAFFKRMEKNGTFRTKKNAVPNPGSKRIQNDYMRIRIPLIIRIQFRILLSYVENIVFIAFRSILRSFPFSLNCTVRTDRKIKFHKQHFTLMHLIKQFLLFKRAGISEY